MQPIRIIEIPDCKMVSSGVGMFGQEKFDNFHKWFASLRRTAFTKDFLFWDGEYGVSGGFHWLYMHAEDMAVPAGYDIIDFKGGLFAVATGIDGKTDITAMDAAVDEFLRENGFARDDTRPRMGNVITPPQAGKTMGYEQMDYFYPVTVKPK
jgi:AraC family transcriptional regulator